MFCLVRDSNNCKINIVLDNKLIEQFRYVKIQPKTIDLNKRLQGINPTNAVVIPQSLVLRSRLNFNLSKLIHWQLFSHLLEYHHQNQVFHQKGLGQELVLGLRLIIRRKKKL